jgi:tetratricopeptide (TPR) repeat protein
MRHALAFPIVAAVIFASATASADSGEADRAMSLGRAFYAERRHDRAREQFIAAFELRADPIALYYLGDTYRAEGAFRQALLYYRRFLAQAPPDHPRRAKAARYAVLLERALFQRAVDRGERGRVESLAPTAQRAAPAGPPLHDRLFAASATVTGIGLATWVVGGFMVKDAESDLVRIAPVLDAEAEAPFFSACTVAQETDGPDAAEIRSICARGERWSTITNVAAITTLASTVVTAYFGYRVLQSRHAERERSAAVRVQPAVGPSVVGLELGVDF